MARPRSTPLPRGITVRRRARGPDVYLVSFSDQDGVLRQELAGPRLDEAKRLLAQRRAEVRDGTYTPAGPQSGAMTLEAFAAIWLEERRAQGMRSIRDAEIHLRLHILPALGSKPIGDLRPRDVAAWVESMKGTCSAKSIANRHGTLHSVLEAARFRELIVANPASLPRGMLPRPAKKRQPRFSRDEVGQLLTDERIAEHRRVFYALQALGGMRLGEASGRRWRDLDTDTPELHALEVASQYEDRPLKTARDEDTRARVVPVHPELASLLARWRMVGWPEQYGRHPRPDDWLVPDPRTFRPRTREQARNALIRDCERIGIEPRGMHAFRRAFISLARSDGARKDVLEVVTHNAAGAVIDLYTLLEWQTLCEAVRCLRVDLRRGAVIALPRAANAPELLDAPLDALAKSPVSSTETHGGVGSRTSHRRAKSAESSALSPHEGAGEGAQIPTRSGAIPEHLTRVKRAVSERLSRENDDAVRDALRWVLELLGT